MVKSLFGGSESKQASAQQSSGGFSALPQDIQDMYRDILSPVKGVIDSASDYFSPMDLTAGELEAQQLLDPSNIQSSLARYLNPFQARIEEDINRQFEAPQSALTQRASEAGAFGGSRYRDEQADLERARLDALAGASANQYNTAYDQLQRGIASLLGFGGLERDLDLQQRQALPKALSLGSSIFAPLLSARESTGTSSGASDQQGGIIPGLFG